MRQEQCLTSMTHAKQAISQDVLNGLPFHCLPQSTQVRFLEVIEKWKEMNGVYDRDQIVAETKSIIDHAPHLTEMEDTDTDSFEHWRDTLAGLSGLTEDDRRDRLTELYAQESRPEHQAVIDRKVEFLLTLFTRFQQAEISFEQIFSLLAYLDGMLLRYAGLLAAADRYILDQADSPIPVLRMTVEAARRILDEFDSRGEHAQGLQKSFQATRRAIETHEAADGHLHQRMLQMLQRYPDAAEEVFKRRPPARKGYTDEEYERELTLDQAERIFNQCAGEQLEDYPEFVQTSVRTKFEEMKRKGSLHRPYVEWWLNEMYLPELQEAH